MREMVREPQGGELYRHFKNGLYRVITVATHSETGERLVIYQAQYGDWQVYARPLEMFVSEVDRAKYPDVTQRYRFERVGGPGVVDPAPAGRQQEMPEQNAAQNMETRQNETAEPDRVEQEPKSGAGEAPAGGVSPKLMAFLDADDLEERYQILVSMRDEVNDHLINNMAVVMDVVIPEGEIGDRYEQLKNCIRTKQRYEAVRMR